MAMQTTLEPRSERDVVEVHTVRALVDHVLRRRMAPSAYLKILAVSSLVEGTYASRLYMAGGAASLIGVPLIQHHFGVTRDQALATELVPILLGYVTLKILVDLLPEPKGAPERYRGWLLTPISVLVVTGFCSFFGAIG